MTTPQDLQAFDVLVIGAGMSGLYQLYRLCEAGFTVRGLEAGYAGSAPTYRERCDAVAASGYRELALR